MLKKVWMKYVHMNYINEIINYNENLKYEKLKNSKF